MYMSKKKEMALILLLAIIRKRAAVNPPTVSQQPQLNAVDDNTPEPQVPVQNAQTTQALRRIFDWSTEEKASYTP